MAVALLIARRSSPVACRLSPHRPSPVVVLVISHRSESALPSSQLQVRSCARDFPLARSTKCAGSEREETFGVVHSFVPPRPPSFFPNTHPSLLFALLSRASIPAPKFRPFPDLFFLPFPLPSFLSVQTRLVDYTQVDKSPRVKKKKKAFSVETSFAEKRESENPRESPTTTLSCIYTYIYMHIYMCVYIYTYLVKARTLSFI